MRPAGFRTEWVAAAAAGLLTFGYRYLAQVGFPNDHFVHLSIAQQITLGALPVRDFVERGFPLMSLTSAFGQVVFGPGLASERLVVLLALAVAAALLVLTNHFVSRSVIVATMTASVTVLAYPLAYAYPKMLVNAIAFAAAGAYCARPSLGRVALLAGALVAAFLFRHDYGVLLAGGTAVMFVARHGWNRDLTRASFACAAVVGLLVAPYLVWVQTHEGLVTYFADGIEFSRYEAGRTMRWTLPALALEPRAAGIAVLFYSAWLLPTVAILVVWRRWSALAPSVRSLIVLVAVVQIGMNVTMLRDPLDVRVRDVLAPTSILAAFVASALWTAGGGFGNRIVAKTSAALALLLLTAAAAGAGGLPQHLGEMRAASGIGGLRERWLEMRGQFAPPLERTGGVSADMDRLVSYVSVCTPATARVLTMTFAPELFFYTRRGFAGGHVALTTGYYTTERHASLMLDRLQREDVPLVVMDSETQDQMGRLYPRVVDYVRSQYREFGRIPVDARKDLILLGQVNRPAAGTFGDARWPCYVGGQEGRK